ncbi:hypothetical protein MANES_03G200250v8 [Manihot esculenta]|uniref:Uncharacterized protein n=1 Tax=Manihot esculenta TaxID=3983 RepID=A0ACB7I312_MANES|nr:hypothetical protein MANES_03G200250v8 [Manihot esculenta]
MDIHAKANSHRLINHHAQSLPLLPFSSSSFDGDSFKGKQNSTTKIKKALHGINGIYDLYIDFPQQKLTVIGWADPEKIVKAIRKTRKIVTICSHRQPSEPPQQPPEGGATPPTTEEIKRTPAEAPQAEAAEPPKDPPPPENPTTAEKPSSSPDTTDVNASQPTLAPEPKDVGEVHVICHHPPDYRYGYSFGHNYGDPWNRHPNCHGLPLEPTHPNGHELPTEPPQPVYVTHSYNIYRPSPYVTEYEYIHSPPCNIISSRMDNYRKDYHENTRNGNITSIFSDENPNVCGIV